MGRKVANLGFLQALIHSQAFDEYHFFLEDEASMARVRQGLEAMDVSGQATLRYMRRRQLPHHLRETSYHCFHLSDCINWPAWLAALRNRYSRQLFPITSLTHSLSLTRYIREMLLQLWEGTTPRDCIVSSSTAGKTVVEHIFAQARAFLGEPQHQYSQPCCRIIPLGVDVSEYVPAGSQERVHARQAYDVGDEDIVVLVFGRISPHSKMDLLPLLRAFHRVFAQGVPQSSIRLMIAGWVDAEDDFSASITNLGRNIGLRIKVIPSPDETAKRQLLAGADIFVSLADNPQETFGLTLLEAGSMGLPVIASDFDGYRDIVVHDQTGLLIPTLGNTQNGFVDELAPLVSDYHYHLWLGQGTAVSVPMLAQALLRLIHDKGLRRQMGQAARDRVVSRFAWGRVLEQYGKLWDELWTMPVNTDRWVGRHPLGMAYGKIFQGYCTAELVPDDCLTWTRFGRAVYHKQDCYLTYAGLEDWITPEMVRYILFCCRKPVTLRGILQQMQERRMDISQDHGYLLVMWALKQDLIRNLATECKGTPGAAQRYPDR